MPDDVQAKRCMLFGGLRMVYERRLILWKIKRNQRIIQNAIAQNAKIYAFIKMHIEDCQRKLVVLDCVKI